MPITFAIDEKSTSQSIYDYAETCEVTLAAAVTHTAALWVRSLIQLTPPNKKGMTKSPQTQKKYGEAKADRDVRWLFPVVSEIADSYRKPRIRKRLNDLISKDDRVGLAEMLKEFGMHKVVSVLNGPMRQMHVDNADKSFHITKDKFGKYPVIHKSARDAYLRMTQSRVGWMKGGWNKAAEKLGVRVPAWIRRHQNSPGKFIGITDRSRPSIEFHNNVEAIGDRHYKNLVEYSAAFAYRSLEKEVRYYLNEIGRGNRRKMLAKVQSTAKEAVE